MKEHKDFSIQNDNSNEKQTEFLERVLETYPSGLRNLNHNASESQVKIDAIGHLGNEEFLRSYYDGYQNYDIESVIGPRDDRKRVWDTSQAPYRFICSLKTVFPKINATVNGTGALIAPNMILTCAHNVYRHELSKLEQEGIEIGIYAGLNGSQYVAASSFSTVHFPKEYLTKKSNVYDYAVIRLNEPIGRNVGFFNIMRPSDELLDRAILNVTGYPTDRDPLGRLMFTDSNRTYSKTSTDLFYQTDTEKGNSGGPIFVKFKNNPIPVIVGIHTRRDTPVSPGQSNQGRRIDDQVYHDIRRWVNMSEEANVAD